MADKTPCCVCGGAGGKHCTKCKCKHYCSKECQLVDWYEGGHKSECKRLAAEYRARTVDALEKLKVADAADDGPAAGQPAADLPAAALLPAAPVAATGQPAAISPVAAARRPAAPAALARLPGAAGRVPASPEDAPDWRGTCAICLDVLPAEGDKVTFLECCNKSIAFECSQKCMEHDKRCPLCRTPASKSDAEWLSRLQTQANKGSAPALSQLGDTYRDGGRGVFKNLGKAFELYTQAAQQGYALAQNSLGLCFFRGHGTSVDFQKAYECYAAAAAQGYPRAMYNVGVVFFEGKGVEKSQSDALRWWRLAAIQGDAEALYNLGAWHASQDAREEALRLFRIAASKGHVAATAAVQQLEAEARGGQPEAPRSCCADADAQTH